MSSTTFDVVSAVIGDIKTTSGLQETSRRNTDWGEEIYYIDAKGKTWKEFVPLLPEHEHTLQEVKQ